MHMATRGVLGHSLGFTHKPNSDEQFAFAMGIDACTLPAGGMLQQFLMNIAIEQWPRRHLINVDEYYRMAEVGLLAPNARVELIEGEVVDIGPIGSKHADMVDHLSTLLIRTTSDRALVGVQRPVRLDERSEPQPDLVLLKPKPGRYRNAHPTSADVLLLIEVSDTTLKFDLGQKLSLYAQHGITEVWVVDLENNQLHQMREPDGASYRTATIMKAPQIAAVSALPDVHVELAALFP